MVLFGRPILSVLEPNCGESTDGPVRPSPSYRTLLARGAESDQHRRQQAGEQETDGRRRVVKGECVRLQCQNWRVNEIDEAKHQKSPTSTDRWMDEWMVKILSA